MYKENDPAWPDDIVQCANASCGLRYRAVKLVPTISRPDSLGKLFCPYCGHPSGADARYVWFGLRLQSRS
jgi:hypothetical protein